ncbi:hypothetical protein AAHZ94_34695, partial [Streptomyces sp. HSW2009]
TPNGSAPHAAPHSHPHAAAGPAGRGGDPHDPRQPHEPPLRQALQAARAADPAQQRLVERLAALDDARLLDELRASVGHPYARDLLLAELGRERRVQIRGTAMANELCTEVLSRFLYYDPNGPEGQRLTPGEMAERAADLFTWAVVPVARNEVHRSALVEIFALLCRGQSPVARVWIDRALVHPYTGSPPDLPPQVWKLVLEEQEGRHHAPALPPRQAAPPLSLGLIHDGHPPTQQHPTHPTQQHPTQQHPTQQHPTH